MARTVRVSNDELLRRFDAIEREVNTRFSDRFRRVWVSYTRIGKVRVDVMVTLFPIDGSTYTMRFAHNLTAEGVSLNDVNGLIDTTMVGI